MFRSRRVVAVIVAVAVVVLAYVIGGIGDEAEAPPLPGEETTTRPPGEPAGA